MYHFYFGEGKVRHEIRAKRIMERKGKGGKEKD
jgi:hypothetical protein